jgi:DNA repair exonuclease SbcCD nuclease subunit
MHPELEIFMVPGQHDLPNHSLEKWHRAALGVLDAADCIYFMDGKDEPLWADKMVLNAIPWARPFPRKPVIADGPHERTLAVCHRLVMEGKGNKADFPGASFDFAINLLKKHTEYDVILTGDNHKPFVVEHEGRLLVNPGSMMRMTADQINHRPRVYLYDREKNTVEPHYLKTKRGVISRDHIEEMKEKESRMEAFVTSVKENVEIGLSFEDTLERYISENKITDNIISKLWECIHNE